MAKSLMRSCKGITIVELLTSVLLMGVSFAAIGELVVLNTYASTKLTNTVDGEVGCSRAIRRISEDVRSARIIGNIYAAFATQNQFPDNTSGSTDPYNSVPPPTYGWPSNGFWPTPPYKLGPQTLILQLPVYYQNPSNGSDPKNGLPLLLPPKSLGGSVPVSAMEYVDTVVYQLVPDPANAGTYQLQVCRFTMQPLNTVNTVVRPPINPPQTILVGIVGPINPADGTNQPSIFQYLTNPPITQLVGGKTNPPLLLVPPPPAAPPVPPPGYVPTQIIGVSINLEVQTPPGGIGANVQIAPAHVETYLRASRYLKQTNYGNWIQ